jgi:hypothetical protein
MAGVMAGGDGEGHFAFAKLKLTGFSVMGLKDHKPR